MRVLIQRVKKAEIIVDRRRVSGIDHGMLLLVGIGEDDGAQDIQYMADKVLGIRIFEDENKKMNLNISQVNGGILSVPQFTLYADTGRGNRPGFERAAGPGTARDRWEKFNSILRDSGVSVKEGVFGAHMEAGLINDGPVTIWLDSKRK